MTAFIGGLFSALEQNEHLLDEFIENGIVASLLMNGDEYDLEKAEALIGKSLDEFGELPIRIPAIKFISPEEKELSFGSADIRKLKEYIENE